MNIVDGRGYFTQAELDLIYQEDKDAIGDVVEDALLEVDDWNRKYKSMTFKVEDRFWSTSGLHCTIHQDIPTLWDGEVSPGVFYCTEVFKQEVTSVKYLSTKPEEVRVTCIFPSEASREEYMTWMDGGGEQHYWQWCEVNLPYCQRIRYTKDTIVFSDEVTE